MLQHAASTRRGVHAYVERDGMDDHHRMTNVSESRLTIIQRISRALRWTLLDEQVIHPCHAEILYNAATDAQLPVTVITYPGDHNTLVQSHAKAREDLVAFFQTNLSIR